MKKMTFISIFIFSSFVFAQEPYLSKSNPRTYTVTVSVNTKNNGLALSDLIVNIPLPLQNRVQDVKYIQTNNGVVINDGELRYASFVYDEKSSPKNGENILSAVSYQVTTYDQFYDLLKIKKIEPYNKKGADFINYTRDNLPYINLSNKKLQAISNKLWEKSQADILTYARMAYEYVPLNFSYINANTGLHPLNKVMDSGGGDCGNLSSIYITLLRIKQIPARHVVAIRADNTFHVWSEFYLENIGWIPVDVTFKQIYPNKDYFGKMDKESNGIALNKDVNFSLVVGNKGRFNIDLFQRYGYWYWSSGLGSLDSKYKITETE
ncbi:transglutaminase-like domain-containing protein [Aeromonas enteropelogenes]|uniref:transglutaminase-like domain-containing protein n=1 Tax=Aeromonas enteropelogenes TaxID=29489 RepID=UPI0038CFA003